MFLLAGFGKSTSITAAFFMLTPVAAETSSHTLSFAIMLLAIYPEAQKKMREEALHVWPTLDDMDNSTFKRDFDQFVRAHSISCDILLYQIRTILLRNTPTPSSAKPSAASPSSHDSSKSLHRTQSCTARASLPSRRGHLGPQRSRLMARTRTWRTRPASNLWKRSTLCRFRRTASS